MIIDWYSLNYDKCKKAIATVPGVSESVSEFVPGFSESVPGLSELVSVSASAIYLYLNSWLFRPLASNILINRNFDYEHDIQQTFKIKYEVVLPKPELVPDLISMRA